MVLSTKPRYSCNPYESHLYSFLIHLMLAYDELSQVLRNYSIIDVSHWRQWCYNHDDDKNVKKQFVLWAKQQKMAGDFTAVLRRNRLRITAVWK